MKKVSTLLFFVVHIIAFNVTAQNNDTSFINYSANGKISFLRLKPDSTRTDSTAVNFLKSLLSSNTNDGFVLKQKQTDEQGMVHQKFTQTYNGVPVYLGEYLVHSKNGSIETANGNFIPISLNNTISSLNESQALNFVLSNVNANSYKWQNPNWESFIKQQKGINATFYPKGELYIIPRNLFGNNIDILAYIFNISTDSPDDELIVVVDANTGALINKRSDICNSIPVQKSAETVHSGLQNINCDPITNTQFKLQETYPSATSTNIYTLNYNFGLNSDYINNNSPYDWTSNVWATYNTDKAALDIHWGMEKVLEYWDIQRNMKSYDNKYAPVTSIANSMIQNTPNPPTSLITWSHLNNALCYADKGFIKFGDGDGVTFDALSSLDLVSHEYGHFVSYNYVNFYDANVEPSALNEGFSDIWGACVEDYVNNNYSLPKPKSIWLNGVEILKNFPGSPGYVRNLQFPKLSWDFGNGYVTPDCYKGPTWTKMYALAKGDGHFANGVINKWFYILSMGETGTNEVNNKYNVTGITINRAAEILLHAEKYYFFSFSNFLDARWATIQAAIDLNGGAGSVDEIAVTNAWYAVNVGGLYQQGTNCTPGIYTPLISISNNQTITGNVYIKNDLIVSGSNTLTFDNCNVIFEPTIKVSVNSNATLNVLGSHFSTCLGLWGGIVLDPGAKLNIDGTIDQSSLIEDAEVAISCDYNNTSPSYVENFISLNNTIFNKNNVSIKIENYTADINNATIYPFNISNCIFTSRRILGYNGLWDKLATIKNMSGFIYPAYGNTPATYDEAYIGESYNYYAPDTYIKNALIGYSKIKPLAGIVLNNVNGKNNESIMIGSETAISQLSQTTIFDDLQYGILANNSNLTVRNSTFQSPPLHNSIGQPITDFNTIGIESTNGSFIDIGTPISTLQTPNNAFFDLHTAIEIQGGQNILVNNCDIRSKQDITNTIPANGNNGIRIMNSNFSSIVLQYNNIYNIQNGIYFLAKGHDKIPVGFPIPPINIGNLEVSNNTIMHQFTGAGVANTGNEYVGNAVTLECLYVNGSNNVSCSTNHIKGAFNGIKMSRWNVNNTSIYNNDIILKTNPNAVVNDEYFGISMEGGGSISSTIEQNVVVGSYDFNNPLIYNNPLSYNQTGILLSMQSNTELGCNTVSGNKHGFRFYGNNPQTKWWDNTLNNNNQYGVTLDGAIIGDQGFYDATTQGYCTSNNNWSSTASGWDASKNQYMTNCINGTDAMQSKLYILNDPNYLQLNPDGSGNTDVAFSITPTLGTDYKYESVDPYGNQGALILVLTQDLKNNIPRCGPTPFPHRQFNIGILEEIAQGVINLPIDDAEKRLYVMQDQLYNLAKEDPTLVVNSGSIQQFIYDNQWSSLDFIYFIGKYLAEGKQDVAGILLGMWTPGNAELDENYKRYYEWMIQMAQNPDWMPEKDAVLSVANLCPVKSGTIVYAYRNLYNAITQSINKFDNNCGELGRGVKKPQGFIRLKQKSIITKSNNNSILFPNPASDKVTLKANNINNIAVFDLMGKIVFEQKNAVSNRINMIDIRNLPNGFYVVKTTDTKGVISSNKLIVQH